MPDFSTLTLFFVASAALLVMPGPAVIYIVTRSIDQGRKAGIVSAAGVGIGTFVYVFAAALGISAILVTSTAAFNVVRYLGALYLLYLGIRKLREKEMSFSTETIEKTSLFRIFYQGAIVNLLNPKVALFFFAFLPQFANPARGSVALQIVVLGAIFVLMGLFSDSVYALLAGTAGNWLKGHMGFLRAQKYFIGVLYIGLGLTAVITGSHKSK